MGVAAPAEVPRAHSSALRRSLICEVGWASVAARSWFFDALQRSVLGRCGPSRSFRAAVGPYRSHGCSWQPSWSGAMVAVIRGLYVVLVNNIT